MSGLAERLPDVGTLLAALDSADYLADEALGTSLFLAARMGQPILLEGEPGVGKTEAAKALAQALETPLIRLQCYEGLTSSEALYEWNYPRQLLAIRLAEAQGAALREADLFSAEYLLERPLLAALDQAGRHTGLPLVAGPVASDNRRYAAAGLATVGIGAEMAGYHSPADTPDRVDTATMIALARLVVATGWLAATAQATVSSSIGDRR